MNNSSHENGQFWRLLKIEACGQTVLPDIFSDFKQCEQKFNKNAINGQTVLPDTRQVIFYRKKLLENTQMQKI